jgi:hypothetical protein
MSKITTILAITMLTLLASTASAQSITFSPANGSTVTVQNNGTITLDTVAYPPANDYISYLTSSQGVPSGCSESFYYPG